MHSELLNGACATRWLSKMPTPGIRGGSTLSDESFPQFLRSGLSNLYDGTCDGHVSKSPMKHESQSTFTTVSQGSLAQKSKETSPLPVAFASSVCESWCCTKRRRSKRKKTERMSTDNGMAFSLLFLSGAERQRKRRSRYRGTTLDLSPAFSLKAGRFPQTHIKPRRADNSEDVSASSRNRGRSSMLKFCT